MNPGESCLARTADDRFAACRPVFQPPSPAKVMEAMLEKLKTLPVPLQIPIGSEAAFEGVVDLIQMKAVRFAGKDGEIVERSEVPESLMAEAWAARSDMLELLSHFDDGLMEVLLEEREPEEDEVRRIIRDATLAQQITPVVMGSAFRNKGIQEVLDAVTIYLPCPTDVDVYAINNSKEPDEEGSYPRVRLPNDENDPMVAMVFKTVVEAFGQLTYLF